MSGVSEGDMATIHVYANTYLWRKSSPMLGITDVQLELKENFGNFSNGKKFRWSEVSTMKKT